MKAGFINCWVYSLESHQILAAAGFLQLDGKNVTLLLAILSCKLVEQRALIEYLGDVFSASVKVKSR